MRSGVLLRSTLLLLLSLTSVARAQQLNRRAFPVGDEALRLGGAFTGRASDASAIFYNPGGLVFGHSGSVSLGLSLSLHDVAEVEGTVAENTPLEYESALGVPFYGGGSVQFGSTGDGYDRHALAFATFSPSNVNRRFSVTLGDGTSDTNLLRVDRSDQSRWFGVAYALRPVEWLGVGVSGFVVTRRFEHREDQLRSLGDTGLSARQSQVEIDAELVMFRLGALARVDEHVSLGLMFQFPSIAVGARASASGGRAIADAGARDARVAFVDGGARSPLPWQVRLGVAWEPLPELLITSDFILEGPMGSSADPVVQVDGPAPEPGLFGLYFARSYHSGWVADGALGARLMIARVVPVSVGVFTSLSAAPGVPDVASVYTPDQIHMVGASVSAGYAGPDLQLTVGVTGSLGFGQGLIAAPLEGLDPPMYAAADARSEAIFIYISGIGGAVNVVGRAVVEEVGDLFGDEAPEDEEAPEDGEAPADDAEPRSPEDAGRPLAPTDAGPATEGAPAADGRAPVDAEIERDAPSSSGSGGERAIPGPVRSGEWN